MEALAGSSWVFTTETLVATYKAIVRPILNYAAPIWLTKVSSSHLDKVEVIQNQTLRVATGFHQKAAASHLRVETGVLPMRAHLKLCCQQFYVSVLQPFHPSHLIVTSSPDPPPSQDYPPGLVPPHTPRPASRRWRHQRPSSSGACWKRALTPRPDAFSGSGW